MALVEESYLLDGRNDLIYSLRNIGSLSLPFHSQTRVRRFLCILYWPEAWRAEGRSSGSKPLITMCYLLECFSRGRGVLYSFCTIIYSSPQSLTISVNSDSGNYSLAWNPLSLWLPRHSFLVLLLFFPLLSTLCASICLPTPFHSGILQGSIPDLFLPHTIPRRLIHIHSF